VTPPKGAPPLPETPPKVAAGPASAVRTVVGGAFVTATLISPGSASDKAKTLVAGYAVDRMVTGVTTEVMGARLAATVSVGVGFALTLCGDSQQSCDDQARLKALEELEGEIDRRVDKIFDEEPGAELRFVREKVIRQMYHERGLDKTEPARRRQITSLNRIGECRKDDFTIGPPLERMPGAERQQRMFAR